MLEYVWLIPLGFAAGALGSIIGLGGGIIMVPVLLFAGLPPIHAVSSSLLAAFSNAASSSIVYARQRRIEYKVGLRLGLIAVPGTVLGAVLSDYVAADIFKILFGILLVGSCAYMILKRGIAPAGAKNTLVVGGIAVSASFAAGAISSFFGIGGGVVFVPLMILLLGIGVGRASPTSQFALLFVTMAGSAVHGLLGNTDYTVVLFLCAGAFAGGFLGAGIFWRIRKGYIVLLVCAALVATAAKLFYDVLSAAT